MTTLTNEELAAIIKDQLPRLLAEDPDLKVPLYELFLESFAEKGEVGLLRQELTDFRVEVRSNFKAVDKRFEKLEHNLEEFRSETRAEFGQVDQRFGQMDRRFEQVDRRFEGVNQRFDKLEQQILAWLCRQHPQSAGSGPARGRVYGDRAG